MSDSDMSHKSPSDFCKRIIQTKELIDLVRKQKCLWDKKYPEYRDRMAKDKAWNDIYRQFEPDFDSMKKANQTQIRGLITRKWYNVRDSFRKSLRTGARNTSRPYIYADELKFLEPIMYNEELNKNIKGEKSYAEERTSNDEEDDNEEAENWLNEVFVDIDENISETGASSAKIPKLEYSSRPKETNDSDDNIVTVLANLIQKEEDEDRAFFKSITPAVKSLSEDAKFVFRIQVMKLINNLKMQERQSTLKRESNRNVDSDSE